MAVRASAMHGAATREATGPVIVNASCTFLEPLVYPGDCEVRMYLGEPGRSRASAASTRSGRTGASSPTARRRSSGSTSRRGRSTPLPERSQRRCARLARTRARADDATSSGSRRPSASREANITAFARDARRRRTASTSATTTKLWRWSHRAPGAVLARGLGRTAASSARGASACWSTATGCRARAGSPMRASTSRRTCSSGGAPTTPATRSCSGARTRSSGGCRTRSCTRSASQRVGGARRAWRCASATASRRYMPNMPETIIAMLGAAARGAHLVVVLAGLRRAGRARPLRPDRAARALHRRRLLVQRQADRRSSTRSRDRRQAADGRARRRRAVPRAGRSAARTSFRRCAARCTWDAFSRRSPAGPIDYEPLPFDHPLYILYSSGTTGVPKCIVHGAGGTLLQHLKEHRLHGDVKPGDRAVLLHDLRLDDVELARVGPRVAARRCCCTTARRSSTRGRVLWELADAERMTHFGTSAKYIDALQQGRARAARRTYALDGAAHDVLDRQPARAGELRLRLRGDQARRPARRRSPAAPTSCRCFVLGNPTLPVWRGEIQCRGLGMAVDVFDDDGQSGAAGEQGELVCTTPFPSMPIGFWNDPDGAKYRAAYFERFPGVWCHGDCVEITAARRRHHPRPLGRDAQSRRRAHRHRRDLPPGRAAARGASRALVIGQDWPPGEVGDVRVVLFVKLRDGLTLDEALIDRIQTHDPRQHDAAPRAGEGRAGRPTSRAPRAARSSSSPCATSCTAAR